MSSPGEIVLWWEPKSQTGREKEEGKDLLHDCRVRWVCQERRGKTENTQLIDLCTFAYWYLNPFFVFLAQFDSFKWICVTKVSLSCVFIMTSHHIPDNRRRPPYYRMHYIYCPPFYLSVRFLKRGIPANTKVLIWVAYWYERQYNWCQRMYPSRPRPKQYNWYKNINDIKSTLEYTEETKNWFQVDLVQHVFFLYTCAPHSWKSNLIYSMSEHSVLTRCPDPLSPPMFTCYVAIETPRPRKPIGQPEEVSGRWGSARAWVSVGETDCRARRGRLRKINIQ